MTRDIVLIRPRVSNADCVDGFFIAARPCLLIRDGRVPRNYIRGSLLPDYERGKTPGTVSSSVFLHGVASRDISRGKPGDRQRFDAPPRRAARNDTLAGRLVWRLEAAEPSDDPETKGREKTDDEYILEVTTDRPARSMRGMIRS